VTKKKKDKIRGIIFIILQIKNIFIKLISTKWMSITGKLNVVSKTFLSLELTKRSG